MTDPREIVKMVKDIYKGDNREYVREVAITELLTKVSDMTAERELRQ